MTIINNKFIIFKLLSLTISSLNVLKKTLSAVSQVSLKKKIIIYLQIKRMLFSFGEVSH